MSAHGSCASGPRRDIAGEPTPAELVRFAALAANSHNTQPWRFRVGDGRIDVLPDFSRRTPVVDPDDHHLFASLGCAAENLAIAAAQHHGSAGILEEPDGGAAVAVTFPGERAAEPDLYAAIPARQSTRSTYDGRAVSPADLALLERASRVEGVEVRLFTDRADLERIAAFVVRANTAQLADPRFLRELAAWARFDARDAGRKGDGLPSAALGAPALPRWLGRRLFPLVVRPGPENRKCVAQIRSSAGIAVFVAARADAAHWIRVGRSFQRFALEATALGLRHAHLNQPVEVPEVRGAFARWLGEPDRRPDLVVRFGRGPAMPFSPRRPVEDVIV